MNHAGNRRTQITKRMISEAFLELLQEKDIRSISVRELCARADINRSTFYEYYQSLYDVLPEIEASVQEELFANLEDSPEQPEKALVGFLQALKAHCVEMVTLFSSTIDPEFPDRLLHHPIIMKYITLPQDVSEEHRIYMAEFYLYGCYRILSRWLWNQCSESPEIIAALIIDLCKRSG